MKRFELCERIINAPHTLICGSTGSGKSTLINSTICTFIATYPKCRALILIDTKKVELYQYRNLPFILDYADEINDVIMVLTKINTLMRNRYETMRNKGVKRYYDGDIWLIIDELADLMNCARANEIKQLVTPILQLGRASGIHIIAGTQAPNRRTIPAEMTSNFTMRIGLKTVSPIESRQAVGFKGCENLPLYGQGWVVENNYKYLCNMPYMTEDEIEKQIKGCRN